MEVCQKCQLSKGIVCSRCKKEQGSNCFYSSKKICKQCIKEDYRQKHPLKINKPVTIKSTVVPLCECEKEKVCNRCKKSKILSEFHNGRTGCKDCRKEYNKQHYGLRKAAYDATRPMKIKKMPPLIEKIEIEIGEMESFENKLEQIINLE